jgi:hypothetical protein
MNILPKDIKEKMKNAQPFLKEKVADTFKGLPIYWQVHFKSIWKNKGKEYSLTFLDENNTYPWIYCDVNIENYPQFKNLEENEKIFVEGNIDNVSGMRNIKLKDCKFYFSEREKADSHVKNIGVVNNIHNHGVISNSNIGSHSSKIILESSNKKFWEQSWFQLIILLSAIATVVASVKSFH